MKKFVKILAPLFVVFLFLTACQTNDQKSETKESKATETKVEPIDIRLAGLKGPTSIGMVKLLDDNEQGKTFNQYQFTMAATADEIVPKLTQGELDVAAVPANLASVIYNNTEGKVKLLAINTLGVLSIVEKGDNIKSLSDLKGQTIYATGKGSTPEYALKYLLAENGLDPEADVNIEWKSEPTEIVQVLAQSETGIAMLPQPFVTVAKGQVDGLKVAVDLNQAWNDLDNGSQFLTGVIVGRTEFVDENSAQIDKFLEEYQASTQWVNQNVADAAVLVEKYGIVKAAVAEKAIPDCNITFIAGKKMKQATEGYLQILFDQNPKSIGGKLPDADFYYGV